MKTLICITRRELSYIIFFKDNISPLIVTIVKIIIQYIFYTIVKYYTNT